MAVTIEELAAQLTLDIEGFVRGAMRAAQSAEDIADAAKDAGKATDDIAEGSADAGRAAGKLGDDLTDLTGRIDDVAAAGKDVGDAAEGLEEIGDAAEGAGGKMGGIGEAAEGAAGMIAGAFAGGAAVEAVSSLGGKLSEAFATALDFEAANDKTAAQLGLGAEAAATYGQIAGELFANNYGESIGQVNEALVLMNRNVGDAVGEQEGAFETATASVLDLASAMDQDLAPITKAIGQMIKTGLAEDAAHALDILTVGFQQGADASEDLLDTFNEYSTQFRQLGLTGEQAMGMISQAMKAGARDSDIAADALKEFAIRARDGNEDAAEGFAKLGLSAKTMSDVFAKGGPEAAEALDVVFDRLRSVSSESERDQLAFKLFGSQAEDLAGALYAIDPSSAVTALGDVGGAAQEMGTTLADNAGSRIETFKRQLQSGLVDFMGDKVLPAFNRVADAAKPAFDTARAAVQLFIAVLQGDGSGVDTQLMSPEVIDTITTVGTKIRELADTVLPKLREWWDKAWEAAEKVTAWVRQNEDVLNGLKVYLGAQLVLALGAAAVGFWSLAVAAGAAAVGVIAATWPAIAIAAAVVALAAAVSWAYRNWGWFKTAVDAVAQAAVWLWNNALVPLGGFIAGTLVPALMTAASAIGNFLANLAGWAGNIPQALGAIIEFFENLPGNIIGFLSTLWATISGWVVQKATELPGLLIGWVTSFWSWLEMLQNELPGRLAYMFGFIIGWIVGMHVVLAENLVNWALAFWEWITTTAAELPGRLVAVAEAVWAWLSQTAAEMPGRLAAWWEAFKQWAFGLMVSIGQWGLDAKNALFSWVAQTAAEMPGRLAAWWEAFKQWAYNLQVSIGQWGIDATNRIRDWISGVPGAISGALSGMLGIGRSIVEGIWNGISGAGGWLMDKIRGFAAGIVSGFMSAIKGGSPAMKLVPVGQSVIQGIDLGLQNEAGRLATTAARVMDGLTYTMQDAARDMLAGWDRLARGESFGLEGTRYMTEDWPNRLADAFHDSYPGWEIDGGQAQSDAFKAWAQGTATSGGGGMAPRPAEVRFTGNTSDALATAIMQMIRSGQIQINPAA